MSSSTLHVLLQQKWQPLLQFVRYRRINFKRPRLPHYDRKLVLHVCKPFFKKPEKPMHELCLKPLDTMKMEEENPYRTLLGREALNWFNNSNMILFFHQNPMEREDVFKARVLFKRQNLCLRYYFKDVVEDGLTGSRYEAVLPLFRGPPVHIAFGNEPAISSVLKINKKVPQLILLCGIIDNRLLNKSELMEYTKFASIQSAQAQLVSVLNSAAVHFVDKLNQPQQTLVNYLEKHLELQNVGDKPND